MGSGGMKRAAGLLFLMLAAAVGAEAAPSGFMQPARTSNLPGGFTSTAADLTGTAGASRLRRDKQSDDLALQIEEQARLNAVREPTAKELREAEQTIEQEDTRAERLLADIKSRAKVAPESEGQRKWREELQRKAEQGNMRALGVLATMHMVPGTAIHDMEKAREYSLRAAAHDPSMVAVYGYVLIQTAQQEKDLKKKRQQQIEGYRQLLLASAKKEVMANYFLSNIDVPEDVKKEAQKGL